VKPAQTEPTTPPQVQTQAGAASPAVAGAAAPPPSGPIGETMQPSAAPDLWCGVKKTLDTNCKACHNAQKVAGAPMALETYADTQATAVSDSAQKVYTLIGRRVHDKVKPMPPQAKLTDAQLANIDAWVAKGAPSGPDPTCAAQGTPDVDDDDWVWPTNCDATYKVLSHGATADSPHVVPATQETHPNVSVAAPWGNEQVQLIAWRAIVDNPRVLHHWILYGPSGEHIVGWSPGKKHNAPMPADVGMFLPSGNLRLNMHYNNLMGSSNEPDRSGMEVCVLKGANRRPKTAATFTQFSQFAINLPAHATDVNVTGTCNVTANQPVTLLSASPHAHRLAHHMKFTVQKASGESIVMLDADFNYEEQGSYELKMPVSLASGDKVITTCMFTNDTNSTVTFGENTEDEMCFNFAVYYPMGALSCGLGGGRFGF
jgi:mono/diheme cytochrome c family protein